MLDPTGEDHSIGFVYLSNTHDTTAPTDPANDNVRMFSVTTSLADNTFIPTLEFGTDGTDPVEYYAQGELYRTVTRDENHTGTSKNHTTEEFTDKQGRVVLKRTYADMDIDNDVMIGPGETEIPHDTYYVYDDFGNLTYVLPPKMDASTESLANIITNLPELGYQYTYDHRNRLVVKQIPGKGVEYIVYNKLDQPILTQDANQRAKSPDEWLFTKYDAFGRVAYTGKATSSDGTMRSDIQGQVDLFTEDLWVKQSATNKDSEFSESLDIFYDNGAYPNQSLSGRLVSLSEILTINYYDNYDFFASEAADMDLPASAFYANLENHDNINKLKTKGLPTGGKIKVLETNDWITNVTGYDHKGRAIYDKSKNGYLGTLDISESRLDFVGKVTSTRTSHSRNGTTIVTLENYTYDHVGRLLVQTQCIGDQSMGYICEPTAAAPFRSGP